MPNTPLQTFRAVEGASPAFTAGVSLASQPFVLYHTVAEVTGSGAGAVSNASVSWAALDATRFRPWLARDLDATYPVKVPNAYNRVYIYPVYIGSTDDVVGNIPSFTPGNGYRAPYVFPFGLQPETRGHTTVNKLNPKCYRFPDDIISHSYPSDLTNFATRTNGLWSLMLPVGATPASGHGELAAVTNATFGRNALQNGSANGVGNAFALPNDFTISTAGTSAVSPTSALAGNNTMSMIGMGHEFQTMGSEELVVSLGSNPTINWGYANTSTKKYRAHLFLMGMFLG